MYAVICQTQWYGMMHGASSSGCQESCFNLSCPIQGFQKNWSVQDNALWSIWSLSGKNTLLSETFILAKASWLVAMRCVLLQAMRSLWMTLEQRLGIHYELQQASTRLLAITDHEFIDNINLSHGTVHQSEVSHATIM